MDESLTMAQKQEPVISVRNLKKEFSVLTDRPTDLKSYLVRLCTLRFSSKQRSHMKVLDGVSFDIYPGEIVGIMGRNGTGKSTLFRLLSGIYSPDSGTIRVTQKMAALVGLGAGFHPELTGYENIFLNGSVIGFSRAQIHAIADKIVEFSELGDQIRLPVKNYSNGMILRLGFSIAAHIDAQILLLDEILGVGDEGFQRKSLNKLLELIRSGRTIVIVTHDSNSVLAHCTRCLVMDHGKILFDGKPAEGVARYSALFSPPSAKAEAPSIYSGNV